MSISRRSFLGSLAGGSLALLCGSSPLRAEEQGMVRGYAYVASGSGREQGLHVFRVEGQHWVPVQFVASSAPVALALSPDERTLFAVNRIDSFLGLPTGSVESYRIEPHSGTLTLQSRVGLSLSATCPEHLAVSPDGRQLAVAATGGGCYNVFSVAEDGSLLPVRCVRKELGYGPHEVHQTSAHPSFVRFDSRGSLLATDLGADTVSVLHAQGGLLRPESRVKSSAGAGPRCLALNRSESVVVVAGGLNKCVSTYRYDLAQGRLAQDSSYAEGTASTTGRWTSLVAHPERDLVLGSWTDGHVSGVVCWQLDPETACLRRRSELTTTGRPAALVLLDARDNTFVVLDQRGDRVHALQCHAETGELSWGADLAKVPHPCSIVLRRT